MEYLERVESFVHVIFPQKVSDEIVNNLEPSDMLGLVVDFFLCRLARHYTFPEGASHESLEFVDIVKTVLEVVEIVDGF